MDENQVANMEHGNGRTIAVDLDGCLAQYDGNYKALEIGEPVDKAREFLRSLHELGYRIVVFTSRTNQEVTWHWLRSHDMAEYVLIVTNVKPLAIAYVDDRAVQFDGDWSNVINRIHWLASKGPWWKSEPEPKTWGIDNVPFERTD